MGEFTYAYEKMMHDEGLSISDLTEDAVIGINNIKELEKKKRTPEITKKIRYHDKAIISEIEDILYERDKEQEDDDSEEHDNGNAEGIEDEQDHYDDENDNDNDNETSTAITQQEKVSKPTKEAIEVEAELESLWKSGKKEFPMEELKTKAPKSWKIIFDNYTDGDNGVETSKYQLFEENEEKVFTINKL